MDLKHNILFKTSKIGIVNFIFILICLIFNSCLIYLRILTISTDEEIGLYKINTTTNFVKHTSFNILFDVIIIILNFICIGLSYKIYVNADVDVLKEKANSLDGYVKVFNKNINLADEVLEDNPEIKG